MTRQLQSLACVLLPGVGLVLTCLGAYLVTLQHQCALITIPVYVFVVVGFLSMLSGVLWNLCHSMKSKVYQRGQQEENLQVFTIDRPSSFPPSYEDSNERCGTPADLVLSVDGVDRAMTLAPPLYSQDSSQAPDCTWSWERPPRYSQVEGLQQQQQQRHQTDEAAVEVEDSSRL